jgi:hypothetical protein
VLLPSCHWYVKGIHLSQCQYCEGVIVGNSGMWLACKWLWWPVLAGWVAQQWTINTNVVQQVGSKNVSIWYSCTKMYNTETFTFSRIALCCGIFYSQPSQCRNHLCSLIIKAKNLFCLHCRLIKAVQNGRQK